MAYSIRWYLRQSPLVLNDGEFLVYNQLAWTGATPVISVTRNGTTSFTAMAGGEYSVSDDNRTYSYDLSYAEGETQLRFDVLCQSRVSTLRPNVGSTDLPDSITYNRRTYKYLYTQTFRRVSVGGQNLAAFVENSAEREGALTFSFYGEWYHIYPIYVRKPIVTFKDADGTVLKTEEVDAGWNVKGVATPPTLSPEKGYSASWSGDYENVTADTDVTAKYTRTDYFVTFNGNGSTAGTMAEQAFKVGASQALTANAFQKVFSVSFKFPDGSTSSMSSAANFLGWAKTAAGSPIWKDKQIVAVSADTLVYASWGRGAAITLPTSASTAAGKVLKWYSSNGFAASSFVGNAGDSYTPTAGVTLYGREEDAETPASNVGDYEYVIGADVDDDHPHGDMDMIIINGEIMPLRTGASETTGVEKKRILRGEDVVFLMEWARQRIAAIDIVKAAGSSEVSYDWVAHFKETFTEYGAFTRLVSAAQMARLFFVNPDDAGTELNVTYYSRFVAASALAKKVVVPTATQTSPLERCVTDFDMKKVEELGIDFPAFASGDALSLAKMSALFEVAAAAQDMALAYRQPPCSSTTGLSFPANVKWRRDVWMTADGTWSSSEGEVSSSTDAPLSKSYYNAEWNSGTKTFSTGYVFCKPGVTLFDLHAPHAVKVVALCAFRCYSNYAKDSSGDIIYKIVYIPVQMEEQDGKRFVLTTDGFDADFVDELCEMYGETWETSSTATWGRTEQGSFTVSSWGCLPIVFFDDHTRIAAS